MSYSKNISQPWVKQNLAKEFLENVEFQRKHPFLAEWKEWRQTVANYYDKHSTYFASSITRGLPANWYYYTGNHEINWSELSFSIQYTSKYWKVGSPRAKFYEIIHNMRNDWDSGIYDEDCQCHNSLFDNGNNEIIFPYEECKCQRFHLLKLYCSLISHYFRKSRRSYRKYYVRLIKILFSLPLDKLLNLDYEMIFSPHKFSSHGRNLLQQIYARGYFDKYTNDDFNKMPFVFEEWKHKYYNPKQQSGTDQCVSASMFDNIAYLASKIPEQQGLFPANINMVHDFVADSPAYSKFEKAVNDTQEKFFSGLKNTLYSSAKEIMILFVFTATIAMLGYTVVKYGQKVILKALNMLYNITCGTFTEQDLSIKQQSDGLSIPFIPAMILNNVISPPTHILSKIWNNPQTDKIMRRIGYLGDPKMSKGVDKISDWIKQTINSTVRWFKETILGIACEEDIESECSPVQKWQEDCDQFFNMYFEGKMQWNDMNWSILMNLYGRGVALTRQTAFNEFKQDVWKVVFKLGNILEKFNAHGRVGSSVRNPPVTIYLSGGTGVGKSSITYPLAAEILKGIFAREQSPLDLKKYWKNLIYMRSSEQEFWDGYENQLVTVFDDFSQLVDSQSSPNIELFEVIRAANSFPYPLHMASIDQKATTTFNSKIILVSSNLDKPKTASLNFETALFRRFDICVKVSRKPGVKTIPGVFDPTIYMFQKYDMVTGALGEFVSYKDIILQSVTEYYNRKGFVDTMDDYITKVLSEPDEVPVEQGLGTALGNTACAVKLGIKYGINSVHSNYIDFKSALTGDIHHKYWLEARLALENLKLKTIRIKCMWAQFREEHPYLVKAMKFVGILALVVGVLKLYSSFTKSEKKEKFMSPEQFVKGSTEESYNPPQVKGAKVEYQELCNCEYEKSESKIITIIKNLKCSVCKLLHINENRVMPPKEQGWYQKMNLKIQDWMHGTKEDRINMAEAENWVHEQYRASWKLAGSPKFYRIVDEEVVPVQQGYNPPQVKGVKAEGPWGLGWWFKDVCIHDLSKMSYSELFVGRNRHWLVDYNQNCEQCVVPQVCQEQGVKDINASEMMMKIIRSNYYKIYHLDSHEAIGHALFLRGKIVMCPKHYMSAFKKIQGMGGSNRIYFRNVFLDRAFELDVSEIITKAFSLESPEEQGVPILSRDIMAFPVVTATYHSDIEPFFAEKDLLSYTKSTDVMLPVLLNNNVTKSERSVVLFRYAKGHSALGVKPSTSIENDEGIVVRIMRNLWEYSMDTQPTECGAPLIVRNVNIAPGKIVGMHVAGVEGSGLGYSTPVYKQDIRKILENFSKYDTVEFRLKTKLNPYPKEQCQVPEEAEFIRLGSVDKSVAQPVRSKILPSPIHGEIRKPITKPCALRPVEVDGQTFDPRKYRLGRLGNIPQFIRQLEIDFAQEALVDEISDKIKNMDFGPNIKSVYTFEEAVAGIDGEEYINSIKRNTSPGYPFVHMKGFETRKQIFGDEERCNINVHQCQIIKRRVENIIEEIKQGRVSEHIFMDTLKDERKPIHKAHKTRLFSAGPLDYLIVCKMYFNGIVAVLQKARNFSHVSVGTNAASFDWSNIARELLLKADNIIAGDFEGFDASQVVQLLQAAGMVLINLSKRFCGTTDEEAYIMWCLLISLFNSTHITGNEVYMWTHSLPSGHYLTAVINSIFVLLCFCIVWQLALEKANYMTARSFFKKCGIVAYGDDHLVSIPQEFLPIFNQQTLISLFKRIGLGYTMEDKDAVADAPARHISEVAYLKRKFLFDNDRQFWLGPISMDTILETPMWIHKCPDPNAQTIEELDSCLRELSLHDCDTWNKWAPVLISAGRRLGHYTEFVNQEETRAFVLE
ncbi:non-structural polyprotein [Myrmica scabrinodis virus 2]|nr:non-structural polyprotein [Myrmica scabrinodis virus 2]